MRWSKVIGGKSTLQRRLMLLILGGNLLLGILVGIGYLWNRHVADETRHASQLAHFARDAAALFHPLAELIDDTNHAVDGTLPVAEFRARLANSARALGVLKAPLAELPPIGDYHATEHYEDLTGKYQTFERASAQTLAAAARIADALSDGIAADQARALYAGQFEALEGALATSLTALSEEAARLADTNNNYVLDHFTEARQIMLPLLLLAPPLSFLLGIAMVSMIVRPLRSLRDNMHAMVAGEGDLSARLPGFKGEAGEVAALYNQLVDKIHHVIEQVVCAENHLKHSSQRLLANAEQTRLGLTGQETEVEDTIAKMQGLGADIVAVGQHAGTAREATEDAQARSAAGREAMQHAMTAMRRLDDGSATAAQQMEQLTASVGSISIALDVINKLAEQTNLLALNAAIEAARAGESGRGFAVVADEVRNLAMRTRDSTGQIGAIADEVRRQVGVTHEAMNLNRHYVHEALEQVEGVAATLTEIDTASQRIAGMSRQIAEAVDRQNDTAANISRNSINLRMTTRQAEANAVAMESLSTELDTLVQRLYGIVCVFNVTQERAVDPQPCTYAAPDVADGDIELF